MGYSLNEIFKGFSKLTHAERLQTLKKAQILNADDVQFLTQGGLQTIDLGEKFIENVLGYFQMPLGVATNFNIDEQDFVIPMAVEETSIVAAASKTARWVREHGTIKTEVIGSDIIGQIQFSHIKSADAFKQNVLRQKNYLIEIANKEVANGLVQRGGGVTDIQVRILDREDVATENLNISTTSTFTSSTAQTSSGNELKTSQENSQQSGFMGVVHVLMNPCDAMGANIINQVCEFLKAPLEEFTQEKVTMCILSNLVDTKLTKATVVLNGIDVELAKKIEEASLFAEVDSYRAATNNKGVLNGIDPILIATGNDWRAVEAGVHAFAARSGKYRSITKWRASGNQLTGEFLAPLIVGTVGGVTALHPMAKMSLRMLNVKSASELSRIMAAVGLVQNLGALKALTTVGIIEGHMKLHIKNLSLGAGATETEMPYMIKKLEEILSLRKRISLANAVEVLAEIRRQPKRS